MMLTETLMCNDRWSAFTEEGAEVVAAKRRPSDRATGKPD
jgi:hypothetical protein